MLEKRWHFMKEQPTNGRPERGTAERAQDELKVLRQVMSLYDRFEQIVALVLSIIIAVIVVAALIELVRIVIYMVETESLSPLEQGTFQLVFGMIMTLLIALEFKHSIVRVAMRREGIIQVKTVVLVALIALARKFVILDIGASPAQIAALAFALLALGVVYWLLRERDDRAPRRESKKREGGAGNAAPPPGAQG
jgi:uncharacterized membrane protein (DUF373 family)